MSKSYYVYIVTNPRKTVLYTGMTNNLSRRLSEHYSNKGNPSTFAGKYHCYNLIYYEVFQSVWMAIAREKEIKGWVRRKKENLIHDFNPEWEFFDLRFVDWL